MELIRRYVDDMVLVGEDDIEDPLHDSGWNGDCAGPGDNRTQDIFAVADAANHRLWPARAVVVRPIACAAT
jgi:hypothetical protein